MFDTTNYTNFNSMLKKIIVVGSTNMDMVVKTNHIPQPGETVLGGKFFMNPGGKGANQAVAISRLGGSVSFTGKIGDDIFGKQSQQLFDDEGIESTGLFPDRDLPSGIALITVDENGENSIVVAPGANSNLTAQDIDQTLGSYSRGDILLTQLEIPMAAVEHAVERARSKEMIVILNPAPVNSTIKKLFKHVDIITPNVGEAEMLSGLKITDISSAHDAAKLIQIQGADNVIITLGKLGAVLLEGTESYYVPAYEVKVVDTTAAGDVFNGALAVAVSEGKTLYEATKFACAAASVAVTKLGAQTSIPYRNEVVLNMVDQHPF